ASTQSATSRCRNSADLSGGIAPPSPNGLKMSVSEERCAVRRLQLFQRADLSHGYDLLCGQPTRMHEEFAQRHCFAAAG
ncbi:hypothetical protein ABT088_54940, partial [Streptomyces mirabilis]|uniref:hypothetical protein n=1 Tax=Streptomyces mirabilis TaxID=68239 RepID=UPI00332910D5